MKEFNRESRKAGSPVPDLIGLKFVRFPTPSLVASQFGFYLRNSISAIPFFLIRNSARLRSEGNPGTTVLSMNSASSVIRNNFAA
jgi:hypothetical protein